jgi:hypothetical protein
VGTKIFLQPHNGLVFAHPANSFDSDCLVW